MQKRAAKQKGKAAEALNNDKGDEAVDARYDVGLGNGNSQNCARNNAFCQYTHTHNMIVIVMALVIAMLPHNMLDDDCSAGEGADSDCDGHGSSRAEEIEGSDARKPYAAVAAAVLDIQEAIFICMSVVD
jgi:hypothetical protein